MKLTGPALIVTWILLAISLPPLTVTSVVTSYEKLRKLVVKGDDILMQAIEDAINKGEEMIKNLTSILVQHFKGPKKAYQFQADHPNDFYLLVKHHAESWFGGVIDQDLLPALEEVIRRQNITFPNKDDFDNATLALVRLQHVYRLKARDMLEGNYLGYRGPSLDMEDAYMLGQQAFMEGLLPEAEEWLQISADLMTQAIENKTHNPQDYDPLYEYVWILSLLGRTLFYRNDTETARKLYDQCVDSGITGIEDVDELREELEADNFTKLLELYSPSVRAVDDNITALCSREKHHRVSVVRPYHVCRYKSDPFVPYRRFREEILSTSPYASVFYDVIHEAEIEKLKELAKQRGLRRGTVVGTGGGRISNTRTGELGWLPDSEDPIVARVSQRVQAFTRLDVTIREKLTSSEKMQVVNYGLGGHYDVHMDALTHRGSDIQNRLATVLFYLTDVEKGGATIFPRLGISVSPVKGMALMWYNFQPHMKDRDFDTHHAGCPVLMGNKWIANKWVWTYGNTFRRPCGPTPQSQQLDVENIVSLNALKEVIE